MSVVGASGRLALVFDGDCGFCTAAVNWLQRLDPQRPILAIPCQAEKSVRGLGLTLDVCRRVAVAIAPDGRQYRGAAAMMAAFAYGTNRPWVNRIAATWPVSWLTRGLYRVLVWTRRWLPGVRPYCLEHPDLCGETV